MRYLFITYFIFASACGPQIAEPPLKRDQTKEENLEEQYFHLVGTINELSNIVLSDFAECSDIGDSADALINKICKVAQAATVEAKIEMKSEISNSIAVLDERLEYAASDLNILLEKEEDYDDRLNTIEMDLNAIEIDLSTLEVRVVALEGQMTDITEGVCYRSKTISPALNGGLVTFAWDNSIRMNSNYCTYNIPTAEYVIQKSGWYELTYKVNIQHTNGNTRLSNRAWVLLNNAIELPLSRSYSYTRQDTQAELATMTISFFIELSTSDTLEIQNDAASGNSTFGTGNASYNMLGPESFFLIKYVDDN